MGQLGVLNLLCAGRMTSVGWYCGRPSGDQRWRCPWNDSPTRSPTPIMSVRGASHTGPHLTTCSCYGAQEQNIANCTENTMTQYNNIMPRVHISGCLALFAPVDESFWISFSFILKLHDTRRFPSGAALPLWPMQFGQTPIIITYGIFSNLLPHKTLLLYWGAPWGRCSSLRSPL